MRFNQRFHLFLSALLLFAVAIPTVNADTVILHNGRKKQGRVIDLDRHSVTLQVDDFLQLKLYRAHVKQIITNRSSVFGRNPSAVAFIYNPDADDPDALPQSDTIDPKNFHVPSPALIHLAEFEPKRTDGGLSDGKTLGVDGRPLSDHQLYARDSDFFAKKVRDGMIRTTPLEQRDRLALLRFLANEVATVHRLKEDLKTGITMESRTRTRNSMLDSHDRFKREATKYQQTYSQAAMNAPEYPLAQQISNLNSAVRTYQLCRDRVSFEERLGIRGRIDLNGGKSERSRILRRRMKAAIIRMANARSVLLKKFSYFYTVGQLPEMTNPNDPAPTAPKEWVIASKNALLFPYAVIKGSAAYRALLEDLDGREITQADALILMEGQKVLMIGKDSVIYPATKNTPRRQADVVEIKIPAGEHIVIDYRSGEPNTNPELQGWILADRVALR